MKRAAAIFCLLLINASAWPDVFLYPLKTQSGQSAQSMDAFINTCSILAQHPLIRGEFEQEKVLSRLGRSLKSSGVFIISAQDGMVWDTLKPFPSTLVLGSNYFAQLRPNGQKTVLSAEGNETFLRFAEVISAVFSGRTQGLLENFEVYFSGGPAAWEMGLLPLDKAIAGFAGKITMEGGAAMSGGLSGDTVIKSITVYEQNGDAIIYLMSNHRYMPELSVNERAFFQIQ